MYAVSIAEVTTNLLGLGATHMAIFIYRTLFGGRHILFIGSTASLIRGFHTHIWRNYCNTPLDVHKQSDIIETL
jgi:hypothetical protein